MFKQISVGLAVIVVVCAGMLWVTMGPEVKAEANRAAEARGWREPFVADWPPEPVPGQPGDGSAYWLIVEVPWAGTTVPQQFRCVASGIEGAESGDGIVVYRISDPQAVFGATVLDAGDKRAEVDCVVPNADPGMGLLVVTHRRGDVTIASAAVDVAAER